jgi:hypothetical protein
MNDQTDTLDEDILSYTVSDEALEAAAGTERGAGAPTGGTCYRAQTITPCC